MDQIILPNYHNSEKEKIFLRYGERVNPGLEKELNISKFEARANSI